MEMERTGSCLSSYTGIGFSPTTSLGVTVFAFSLTVPQRLALGEVVQDSGLLTKSTPTRLPDVPPRILPL
jgi:hypothetical protein